MHDFPPSQLIHPCTKTSPPASVREAIGAGLTPCGRELEREFAELEETLISPKKGREANAALSQCLESSPGAGPHLWATIGVVPLAPWHCRELPSTVATLEREITELEDVR
jgi:hypothetical protein